MGRLRAVGKGMASRRAAVLCGCRGGRQGRSVHRPEAGQAGMEEAVVPRRRVGQCLLQSGGHWGAEGERGALVEALREGVNG